MDPGGTDSNVSGLSIQPVHSKTPIPWKVYLLLVGLGIVGSLGILPYVRTLYGSAIAAQQVSIRSFYVVSFIQGLIMSSLLSLLGLVLASRTGLGVPRFVGLLQKDFPRKAGVDVQAAGPSFYVNNRPVSVLSRKARLLQNVGLPVLVGLLIGAVLLLLDRLVFASAIEAASVAGGGGIAETTWWQGILASFYGGIVEEILLRLFTLNLIVWLLMLLLGRERRKPGQFEIWTAIIISSVVFALGHLATGSAVTEMSLLFGVRIILLNSIAGVTLGYLFVRRGLLTAMTAHFTADIVIHVLTAI